MSKTRTVFTVIREIAAVKAAVSDAATRAALLAPLEAEVKYFADEASRQIKLELEARSGKK